MDHQVTSQMCSSPVLYANKMQSHVLQEAAGQLRRSPHEFAGIEALSPLLWLARGYAIMDGPGFPIVAEGGDDAEPNDTYVQQLTAAARAAVQVPRHPHARDAGRCLPGAAACCSWPVRHAHPCRCQGRRVCLAWVTCYDSMLADIYRCHAGAGSARSGRHGAHRHRRPLVRRALLRWNHALCRALA